jgi:hypothetical protein
MEFYGIKGTTQKRTRSYLRGRYQRVILYINGSKCCSAWKEKQYNVEFPRALYLVQCFFYYTLLTYQKTISDLSKPVLFADDTSILILDKDPANFRIKIDKLLKVINKWFEKNLLVINYEKKTFFTVLNQKQ